jgi:peptide/nickel transport system permease protein
MLVLPGALLVMGAAALLGPGPITNIVAIGLFLAPAFAYATCRNPGSAEDFAIPELRAFRPATPPILMTSVFAWAVLVSIGLDYLGLGVQPSLESLGTLLKPLGGVTLIAWPSLCAASCVLLTVFGAFVVGDGLIYREKA